MFRTFKVGRETNTKNNKLLSYFITDAINNDEIDSRPKAAEFPISQLFDQDTQERRADDYCKYMNLLATAAKEAYEQNQLINVLKS